MRWYYRGNESRAIDLPTGPTVIQPRSMFEAPRQSVLELIRSGLVVAMEESIQSPEFVMDVPEVKVEVPQEPPPTFRAEEKIVEVEESVVLGSSTSTVVDSGNDDAARPSEEEADGRADQETSTGRGKRRRLR